MAAQKNLKVENTQYENRYVFNETSKILQKNTSSKNIMQSFQNMMVTPQT